MKLFDILVGETVNLMSIDSQRLMDLMQSVNSFWYENNVNSLHP